MYEFKTNVSVEEYNKFVDNFSMASITQDYRWDKIKNNWNSNICALYKNNKIYNMNTPDIVYSDQNIDFIPNITKMCDAIGNSPDNIIASYNIGVDYSKIMIALACHRFLSKDDSSGNGTHTSINKLLQLKQEKKILDVRKVFIKLFTARKANNDKIEKLGIKMTDFEEGLVKIKEQL